ncbi:MAG: conserved putative rane protein [Bryobacterales bacterium]|nr:conserved putative rane protein [Bryobacterales bacterium]
MVEATQFVAHYGYAAIFVLLTLGIVLPLIPDETILVFAGIMIHKQTLDPAATLVAAYAGSVCGITLSYILGRTGGIWLTRHGKHLQRTHEWFACYGRWTLFFGYFIVGVRHVTALVAGTAKLEPRVFAAYAYSGGLLWVITFLSIGYFVGDSWERWGRYINGGLLIAAIAAAVAGWVWYRQKHRR